MACSFTLKGVFCVIASVGTLETECFKSILLVTFACLCLCLLWLNNSQIKVFAKTLPAMAVTDGNSMQWKRLLNQKWCHIDREVTPFQELSAGAKLNMVMLSQFVLKGCKLQYNSSLKGANQELTSKYKAIRGRHRPAMHRAAQEEIKIQKEKRMHAHLRLKLLSSGCRAARGRLFEVNDWGLCLFLLAVYLSLSLQASSR